MKALLGLVATFISVVVYLSYPDRVDISAFAGGFATACYFMFILEGHK